MPLAISVVPSIGSTATSHSGAGAVADLLAVVEHRRLVLLALADDDDAAHRDGADQRAHGVDGRAVAAVLVAAPDPAAGGHRGGLGDPDELEGEVAVRRLRSTASAGGTLSGGVSAGPSDIAVSSRRGRADGAGGRSVRSRRAGPHPVRPAPRSRRWLRTRRRHDRLAGRRGSVASCCGDGLVQPVAGARPASAGRCRRAARRAPTAPATPRATGRRIRAWPTISRSSARAAS